MKMVARMKNRRGGARRGVDARLGPLCVVLLLGAPACEKAGPGAAAPDSDHELLGATAPAFEIPAESGGQSLSPADYPGKIVIVDFWATWCDPCKDSFPFYQSLADKYAGRVVVLGVSVDEEPDGIASFVQETGAQFPVGWDEGQAVAQLYKPETMPTSFIVDQHGVIRYVHPGFRPGDGASIEAELDDLLK